MWLPVKLPEYISGVLYKDIFGGTHCFVIVLLNLVSFINLVVFIDNLVFVDILVFVDNLAFEFIDSSYSSR